MNSRVGFLIDYTELSNNIQDLKVSLENGRLNRKNHWKKYRNTVKHARKVKVKAEDQDILGQIDKFFRKLERPKIVN